MNTSLIEIVAVLTPLLSGGTVVYLVADKLFALRKNKAEAHGEEVASFEKEMEVIRKIHLDFLDDMAKTKEDLEQKSKSELAKASEEIKILQVKIESLGAQLQKARAQALMSEEKHASTLTSLNELIQKQSGQLATMTSYLHLLCDVANCDKRHVPQCPFDQGKSLDHESPQ
jgi:septal ring factor EnvC (AmiA/AmiB activator)